MIIPPLFLEITAPLEREATDSANGKSTFHFDESSVRLNEGGVDALIDKARPGRPQKLNANQLTELKEVVLNKIPSDFGFNSATWTGPILISLIEKRYEVKFQKAQIYNILKRLGLTFQKGKGVYPEASERTVKVEEIKKNSKQKGIREV